MSITNFIPSVWAADILKALDTLLVYASPAIMNSDYEGTIASAGDTVRITTLGDVTIKTYTKNSDMDPPEELTDAELTLTVDQQKYFNFQVDDIDKRQALPGLREEAARRAAYGLRKVMDAYMAAKYTEAATANLIGDDVTPIVDFDSNPNRMHDSLVDLGTRLDNTDTPEDGRFAVLPPWAIGYIEKDPRWSSFGTSQNRIVLENGMTMSANGLAGRIAGFDVYKSNQVPNTAGAKYKIIAGHPDAWSRAQQILETEAYRPERRFADALKGLHVYGGKVIRPNQLAVLTATDS
jgi:hypothetical protein